MRYWHPMTAETVAAVKAYEPDQVILLPLYPQFSTTTTASSYQLWGEEARAAGPDGAAAPGLLLADRGGLRHGGRRR